MRPRESALRSFGQLIGTGVLPWDGAIDRVLDYLDDLEDVMRLAGRWPMRQLLGLMPTERLDRWHITVRLSDLAERNAEFRAAFLQQPRLLSALAAFEGIGVGPASYLWQVREATVVEETPGLHWLILPACHHGCQALETLPAGSCIVCGNPRGCAGTSKQRDSPWDLIHDIDERIIRLVQADPSARDRLLLDATSFFGELASAKFRRTAASLGIHEVRVAEDTETSVCFALLATHEPQRCTLALERGFA